MRRRVQKQPSVVRPPVPERLQEAADWIRPKPRAVRELRPDPRGARVCALIRETSVQEIVDWGGVTAAHARLLKSGRRRPSLALLMVLYLRAEGRVMPEVWEGWRFSHDGKLCGPDGLSFVPGEVLAIPFQRSALSAHQAFSRRYRADAEHARRVVELAPQLRGAFSHVRQLLGEAERLLERPAPGDPVSEADFSALASPAEGNEP